MPNIVPGVVWRPIAIDYSKRAKRRKGRGLIGHIAVSDASDLPGNPTGNNWHFYLPYVGPAIQYIDLDYVSACSVQGDATCASFESQGGLGPIAEVNRQTWNDNQCYWAARILRHMHDTEGVPLRVMESSAASERGFGTHRLGVPGYMQPGTEKWSSSQGKACPGDARHNQRAEIVRRAGGDITSGDEFLMDAAAKKEFDELRRLAAMAVGVKIGAVAPGEKTPGEQVGPSLAAIQATLGQLVEAVRNIQAGEVGSVDVRAIADQLTVVPKD